jgi:hypothetical protein
MQLYALQDGLEELSGSLVTSVKQVTQSIRTCYDTRRPSRHSPRDLSWIVPLSFPLAQRYVGDDGHAQPEVSCGSGNVHNDLDGTGRAVGRHPERLGGILEREAMRYE